MPIEYTQLKDKPSPLRSCPKCGDYPFRPFLRGQVARGKYGVRLKRAFPFVEVYPRDYCALICWRCKEIVGYESP